MVEGVSQVKVNFFTNDQDEGLQVSEAPVYVPVNLKRYGLSEIVNHLLNRDIDNEDQKPIPFDFLIEGAFLRNSLEDYLVKNGLSNEAFLHLEYTRAVLPPSFLASFSDEDWVSSVATINPKSKAATESNLQISQPQILAGSYDGIVRTYNSSGKVTKQFSGHSMAVRAVEWISPTRIVSSGNDRQLRLWKISNDDFEDDEDTEEGKTLAILEGHKAPVVSLALDHQSNKILSAGYDNMIGLWSTNYKEMASIQVDESDPNVISTASKKRKKMAIKDSSVRRRAPLAMMGGHKLPVESIVFDANEPSIAYSVSQDHSIKTWDLVTQRCVDSRSTDYPLLSLLQLPSSNLLVCGSSARHINIYDPRITSATRELFKNTKLVGHKNFVVGLSKDPLNDNVFASCSHDGTVKIWDIRSENALFTITREEKSASKSHNKVLDVDWDQDIGIVSGGEDKTIQINSRPSFAN